MRLLAQRVVALVTLACPLLGLGHGAAQVMPAPAPPPGDQPTLMKSLASKGLHDLEDESWNAYGQFTYISSWKPSFPARYTNLNGSINSLLPEAERSFTGTATLFLGVRPWGGAEFFLVPEVVSERPYSQLRGLGAAIQNFELQKGGSATPHLYRSRIFLRQTVGLGGDRIRRESGPMQLGATVDSRRLVFSAGQFTILDFFDKNAFGIDPRQGFLGLGFMTHGAYDFASDARGYSYGAVAELYWDEWAIRVARLTPPKEPNQLPVDFRFTTYFGDQVEIEHKHQLLGQNGTIRLLGYRNRENTGRFTDAIAAFQADPSKNATTCPGFNYGSNNAGAPDLCWVRKPNIKLGIGLFAEQSLGHDIGVFTRAMYSDGQTEVGAYTSTDRSFSVGLLGKGSSWSRPGDVAGAGVNLGWISKAHAEYLALGGVDGFVGDGAITQAAESAIDFFYSLKLQSNFWLTGDYQHIANPGFNADRGPVNVISVRVHAEY